MEMPGIKQRQYIPPPNIKNKFNYNFFRPRQITSPLCNSAVIVTSEQQLNTYIKNDKPKVLAQNISDRKTTIIENTDGSIDMFCNKPEASTLVLSGGGAKGCCCTGVHKALEDTDKWKHIDKLSVTSAGAVMGCLMSTGMNSDDLQRIIDNMKPHAMVSNYDTIEDELVSTWNNSNNEENIVLSTKKKHLIDEDNTPKTIIEKVKFYFTLFISLFIGKERRACKLEKFLCYITSCYFLNKINELDQEKKQEIQDLIDKLKYQKDNPEIASKENTRITFADLDRLSKYIPGMKKLEVNVTIVVNGTAQPLVYSSDNTPDMDIYTAVRISASFPGLFPSYKQNSFSHTNQTYKKLKDKFKIVQKDGGCLVNTPTSGSQNRKELSNNHYIDDCKDSIVIVYGNDLINSSRDKRARYNLQDAFIDFVIGADVWEYYHEESEIMREIYIDQTIMTKLTLINKGKVLTNYTTNVLIPQEDIHAFQNSAYKDVKSHLKKTESELLGKHYKTLKEALFALKDKHLNSFLHDLNQKQNESITDSATEVVKMRKEASTVMDKIKQAVSTYNDDTERSKTEKIISLKAILSALDDKYAQEEEFKTWFSIEMHNSKDKHLSRYINLISDNDTNSNSAFLLALHKESKNRSHRYTVYNIIKTQINPMIFKLGQSKENITLLENMKTSLLCSENEEEIDFMIKQLHELYELTTMDKIHNVFNLVKKKFKKNLRDREGIPNPAS